MKRLIIASILFLILPLVTLAVDGTFLVPSWSTPSPSASYGYANHVVINGTWQLPPDWAGNIYVYADAAVDFSGALLSAGTQKSDVNTAQPYYSISNAGNLAPSSGSFSFDIGPQADGVHNIYIKFVGGEQCAVNTQLNAQYNTNTYQPACPISADNAAFNLLWPARNYTVQLPPYPRMVVTPSADPALNFSNIVFGATQTFQFFVSNTGGQTLTGSISGLSTPFSCSPSCAYTLNPGDAPTAINITFAPLTSPASYSQIINFSCSGTAAVSNGCEGGPDNIMAYQPRHIIGNSIDNSIQPQITIAQASVNYGTVNLGVPISDVAITVKNTGGGILNGLVTFSTSEYTCTGSCSYSLFAGQSTNILIHYVPVTAGSHTDSASFTGGGGKIIPLNSSVNDKPILTYYWGSIDFGTNINVGTCVDKYNYIRNSGAGLLSGNVTNPQFVLNPPSGTPSGFSCTSASCNYNNLTNAAGWQQVWFRFCPIDQFSTSTTAVFTNTGNPLAGGSFPLSGQGNISPIGGFSGVNTVNFGSTLVNTTKTGTITVTNNGPVSSFINGSIDLSNMPNGYTCTSANCAASYSIAGGTSVIFTFTFTPTAVQNYPGSILIPGIGTVNFVGSGVQPDFQMSYSGSPLTMCPGTTCVTSAPQKTYTVGPTTFGGSLAVQNKTFYLYVMNKGSGANVAYSLPSTAHFFCISSCSGALAPGVANLYAKYEFRPDAATTFNEPLLVSYDYGDGVPRSVTLDLEGSSVSAPYLSVSPTANIPLGDVPVGGAPAEATFMVTNDGVGPLDYNVTIPTIGAGAPTAGLRGLWTFDDANTNWATHNTLDTSGQNNTGSLTGPISATGKIGEALNFTKRGGVTVTKVNGLASGNTPHTVAAWVKVNAFPSSSLTWIAQLGNAGGGSLHWLLNSGGTQFGVWGGAQTQPILPVGTWVHVATTFDGVTLKSYKNGILSQSIPASFNIAGTPPLTLGLTPPGYSSDFNGVIDDVRVYNTALNASEIAQVYGNVYPQTASLVEWLKFDDATIAWSQLKTYDSSGKGNNGVLSNVPVNVSGKLEQALRFSGADRDAVTVLNNGSLNINKYTVSVWVNPAVPSETWTGIVGKPGRNYNIWLNAAGYIHHRFHSSGGGSNDGAPDAYGVTWNAWNHVVITNDGITAKTYLNGVEVASGPVNGSIITDNTPLYIGCNLDSCVGNNFKGIIDDIHIFDRALTPSEVSDLFGAGVASGSEFTCVSGCNITGLLPAQSQNVKFNFNPTAAMGYIAYPMFASTNGGGTVSYPAAPYPSMSGTGVLDPTISAVPTSLGFANTNQGLSSQNTITITNTGLGNLSGNVSPVKAPGLNFYCYSGCNFNIPAGGNAPAVIEFAPQSTGALNGIMIINSNGVNTPVSSGVKGRELVDVFGTGTFAPIIDIRGGDTNYGPVVIGRHKDRTFTIKNTGSVDLGTGVFMLTGPFTCVDPVDIGDGLCHYNITAGAQVDIIVRFAPTTVGNASGAVWLSGVPLARFFVSGRGVSPSVKFIEQ